MNTLEYDVDFWKKWNPKELDRQMAPIHWIVNKNKRETLENHLAFSVAETLKAQESVPCKLDISYGEQETERLDLYGINLPSDALTLFWVHGGYWRAGEKSWAGCFVKTAYNYGIKTIVIDYPLAPNATLATMCNSVCQALENSMTMLPGSNFVVGGHSAGAQLVSSLFHKIPSVQALSEHLMNRVVGAVLMSGPYDMRPAIHIPFINKALQLKPEEARDFSPLLTMDNIHSGWMKKRNDFEFHVSTAEHDPPAIKKLGEMYGDMLRKKQFLAEYWVSQDDDHFSEVESMADENSRVSIKIKSFLLPLARKYKTRKSQL